MSPAGADPSASALVVFLLIKCTMACDVLKSIPWYVKLLYHDCLELFLIVFVIALYSLEYEVVCHGSCLEIKD